VDFFKWLSCLVCSVSLRKLSLFLLCALVALYLTGPAPRPPDRFWLPMMLFPVHKPSPFDVALAALIAALAGHDSTRLVWFRHDDPGQLPVVGPTDVALVLILTSCGLGAFCTPSCVCLFFIFLWPGPIRSCERGWGQLRPEWPGSTFLPLPRFPSPPMQRPSFLKHQHRSRTRTASATCCPSPTKRSS